MRGDLTRIGYAGSVEWGRRAFAQLAGAEPTHTALSAALRAIGAPFVTADAPARLFGTTFAKWRAEVVRSGEIVHIPLGPDVTVNLRQETTPEEILQFAIARHERHKRETLGEQERQVTITVDRADQPVMLVGLGDMHLGSPSVDPRSVIARAQLAERSDILVYFISVGDVLEAPFKPKHVTDALDTAVNTPEEIALAALVLDKFAKPGRLLAVGAGNHDLFSHKITGYSHLDAAMDRLSRNVPYARIVMYLTITLRTRDGKHERSFVHEIRHKARGGGKDPAGAARLHLERSAEDIDAFWCGHTHRSGVTEKLLMGDYRLGIQLGTYKQHRLDNYGLEHDYPDENFDADRGVLMWANRAKVEETRTDAGVERLERYQMMREAGRNEGGSGRCSTGTRTRGRKVSAPKHGRRKRRRRAA